MPSGEKIDAEQTPISELFLLRLRYKDARLIRAGSNSPVLLTDPQAAWVVYTGRIDVFLVPVEAGPDGGGAGRVVGTRQHLFRAQVGQAVLGVGHAELRQMDASTTGTAPSPRVALMAVGDSGTQLLRVKRSTLAKFAQDPTFADQVISIIDGWVTGLSTSLARQSPPPDITVIEPGAEISLGAGQTAHPNRNILWVKHLQGGSQFIGSPTLSATGEGPALNIGEGYLPLSKRTWLKASSASKLCVIDTKTWIGQDPEWSALDNFHQLALRSIQGAVAQADQAEREHWQRRDAADRRQVARVFARLASILERRAAAPVGGEDDGADPLLTACRWVGQATGVMIQAPPHSLTERAGQDHPLRNIARASRIRIRPVTLRGQWWRQDSGPLLAYLVRSPSDAQQTGEHPVALLPTSGRWFRSTGNYDLLDPLTPDRGRTPVTADMAARLSPLAYAFYPPLPDRPLTGLDLLKLGLRGSRRDLLTIILVGIALSSLTLITPLMVGILFDTVIPGFQRQQLIQMGLALLVSALAAAMFQLTRNIAALRLEGKLDASVQAAILDRLLRLPAPFFRRYTAGDLAERVLGINAIRQILSGAVVSSALSGLFSILNLALIFYYAPGLAWRAIGLALVPVLVMAVLGYQQMRYQRALTTVQRQISGLVLQLVSGIAKLRMAGVEDRAFARWAKAFSRQKELAFKSRALSNGLAAFNSAYPVITSLVIFALIGFSDQRDAQARLSTGAFLAFSAAFTQFLLASLSVSSVLTALLSALPIYEGVKPVLHTLPEVSPAQADPGALTGEIEISHVAFRYREDEPPALKDVSLRIKPGEFVAVVGASGCGKSTLLRLLLKFETPLSGAIYYDGQDLDRLDVEAVRRQMGVVLQNSKLISGSLLTNIVGSSLLTIDDAWEAAHLVGLAQDIEQMPMGMHTVISEGGANLSGGQRQRLLIARALVNKPRLLFLDEATSALDNPNQALVSASLDRLSATRVVIAHRLSTIVNADCIYVLDEGRIVQSGAYADLMRQRGPFAELAKRQLS